MSDSKVQIDQGTANEFIDATQVTTTSGVVQRQRIAVADATAPEQNLVINPDGSASVSGNVVVTSIPNVAGSVGVTNFPGSFGINNFPANQTVSGSVSVLDFPSNQVVSGSVGVTNFPGSFVANQGTSPWVTSGSVSALQAGIWSVNQGTNPWVTSTSGSVSVLNPVTTVTANQGSPPWSVNASQSGNWGASVSNFPTIQVVSGSVSVIEAGAWSAIVSGSVTAIPYGVQGVSGSVSVNNYPSNQTISGSVQLLPSSSDIGYVGTWATAGPIVGQTSSSVKAVPITTTSYPSTNGILVQGLSTNIASVFVGPSTVASVGATGGFEIQAGQAVPQTCTNANLVYIIGPNNTDGVCWTVL